MDTKYISYYFVKIKAQLQPLKVNYLITRQQIYIEPNKLKSEADVRMCSKK